MLIADVLIETTSRDRGRSSKCELHALGPRHDVSGFLLTAEQAWSLRQGTADDAAIRAALFNRLLPSTLEAAWRVFMPAQAPGILLWIRRMRRYKYLPEQQLTTGLRIRPEKLQDVPAVVHRSSPPIRSVVVTARRRRG